MLKTAPYNARNPQTNQVTSHQTLAPHHAFANSCTPPHVAMFILVYFVKFLAWCGDNVYSGENTTLSACTLTRQQSSKEKIMFFDPQFALYERLLISSMNQVRFRYLLCICTVGICTCLMVRRVRLCVRVCICVDRQSTATPSTTSFSVARSMRPPPPCYPTPELACTFTRDCCFGAARSYSQGLQSDTSHEASVCVCVSLPRLACSRHVRSRARALSLSLYLSIFLSLTHTHTIPLSLSFSLSLSLSLFLSRSLTSSLPPSLSLSLSLSVSLSLSLSLCLFLSL